MAKQNTFHVDNAAALAARLRQARAASGRSQEDIAFNGCSAGYISMIEQGRRVPSLQVVRGLASRLGVSEAWLARGEDRPEEVPRDPRLDEADLAVRLGEFDQAAAIYADLIDGEAAPAVLARAEAGFGQIAFARDDARQAADSLERALELDPDIETDDSFADTYGRALARVGDLEAAIALFKRRLTAAQDAGDPVSELRFSVALANAFIDASAFGEATSVLAGVLRRESELDPFSLARIYWSQSRLHTMKRETEPARRHARRALQLLEATEHTLYRSRAHQLMAFVELDAGNAAEALTLIRRGRELALDAGTRYDAAKFALEEARALAILGSLDEAATLAMTTAAAFEGAHPWDVGRSYAELARIFADSSEPARAAELFELAIEILESAPNRYLADAYRRYGELLEQGGRTAEAFAIYKKGASLNAELDRLTSIAET